MKELLEPAGLLVKRVWAPYAETCSYAGSVIVTLTAGA